MSDGLSLFVFRLAMSLGMTVKTLLNSITLTELQCWAVFYELEPFGTLAEDTRWSMLNCTIANSALSRTNPNRLKTKPFSFKDFSIAKRKTELSNKAKDVSSIKEKMFSLMEHNRKKNK